MVIENLIIGALSGCYMYSILPFTRKQVMNENENEKQFAHI